MRRAVSGAYNIQYAVKVQLRAAGHARREAACYGAVYCTTPYRPGTVRLDFSHVRKSWLANDSWLILATSYCNYWSM